jgi:methionyl-tRNA formyltransferase
MGNPDFAVLSLNELMSSKHEVVAVVTSPDKPRGRGKLVLPTAVAQRASDYALPVIQPALLKNESFVSQLRELKADLFVVVAFRLLPSTVLEIPKIGSMNLHPSLLPKYRGAAPLQWALMNGDVKTGITTFFISPTMDTGDILMTRPMIIFPEDDSGSLSRRASQLGAHLLVWTIDNLVHGTATPEPQDESSVSHAPKIVSEDCKIDWTKPAVSVRNQVCALSPTPGAYTFLANRRLKIFKCALSLAEKGNPGEVVSLDKSSFTVRCGSGSTVIQELQPEGKRRMKGGEFLAGARLKAGDYLGK